MVIKASHTDWAKAVFVPVIWSLLRSRFSNFYCVNTPPEIDPSSSLLLTPNHFSWWDGFFFFHLYRRSVLKQKDCYLMMLETQLKKFWYFRHLGAYSIAPGQRSVLESISYTAELLEDPEKLVVVYPQGAIQSYSQRPIRFQRGVEAVLRRVRGSVSVLPLFFRVEYFEKMKPEIWCGFGSLSLGSSISRGFSEYEANYNLELRNFDAEVEKRKSIADIFSNSL